MMAVGRVKRIVKCQIYREILENFVLDCHPPTLLLAVEVTYELGRVGFGGQKSYCQLLLEPHE